MHELVGSFVKSMTGRDAEKCYVIIDIHNEYVYLVDGNIRKMDHPKRKNLKHIKKLGNPDPKITDKIYNKSVRDEEIKRAIKSLLTEISNKEVKPPL